MQVRKVKHTNGSVLQGAAIAFLGFLNVKRGGVIMAVLFEVLAVLSV